MFVTSAPIPLQSLTDVRAADLECARLASAAGLSGNYLAWVSTATESAIRRLLAVGPEARGWVRPDGAPFTDSIADLFGGRILFPPILTELGDEVSIESVATGTFDDGNASLSCFDWTSADYVYQTGHPRAGSHGWAEHEVMSCADPEAHLYCLGIDYRAPIQLTRRPGDRAAFISASAWDPSGGVSAADALCQEEANLSGVLGEFRAFLATTTSSATGRFDLTMMPWSRTDGVPLVDDPVDVSLGLLSALTVQADGRTHAGHASVWTGVLRDPSGLGTLDSTCMDWTTSSSTSMASVGAASLTTGEWFDDLDPVRCNERHRLYCFQWR
jgi:hypothetical protein